ncbi:2-dehydro-3-deoxyglucarate aldolase [Colletotrichum kahawae]|uniref:2-dehydro-3-deoxyglucarate aldolase n=1 Tax=Colletotrichum kahawae TaxID=34407 RepID=A0AAD9YQB7_COLKA|nr:2-dehydro-3-deoxyglucarate aldolase [Colletotrichum kahawae]
MYHNEKNDPKSPPKPHQDTSAGRDDFIHAVVKKAGPALGVALTIPSVTVSRLISQVGYDFVFIDMEHSPLGPEKMTALVHGVVASSRGSCFPLVRVPSQGVEWIKWALDSGAAGIIVPMVNNQAEMRAIAQHCLYPPRGRRSFGPSNAPWGLPNGPGGGVGEYVKRASEGKIAILPIIESTESVENVEDIISIDGVSGVFIGPIDLRLSLGLSGADGEEPAYKTEDSRGHKKARHCRRKSRIGRECCEEAGNGRFRFSCCLHRCYEHDQSG